MQQFSRLETGPMRVTQESVEAPVFAGDLRVLRISSRVSNTSRPEFNSTPRRRLVSAYRLSRMSKTGGEPDQGRGSWLPVRAPFLQFQAARPALAISLSSGAGLYSSLPMLAGP